MNAASTHTNFGDGNDAVIAGVGITNNGAIISKIASITIGGAIPGHLLEPMRAGSFWVCGRAGAEIEDWRGGSRADGKQG